MYANEEYLFPISQSINNLISIEDYNNKRNKEIEENLHKIKFDKINDIYFLFEQYLQNKNKKDNSILNIISTQIEIDIFDIEGIMEKYQIKSSFLKDPIINLKKYDIIFDLYKRSKTHINKLIEISKKIKYIIIISNITLFISIQIFLLV